MLDFNDAPLNSGEAPSCQRESIRQQLLANIVAFLGWLFPHGVIRGRKFYVGNMQGEAGDSLVIELEGDKAGVGYDHATGESGDLLTFLAYREGLDAHRDFKAVLAAASRWLGSDLQALAPAANSKKAKGPALDALGPHTAKWDYWSADGQLLACVYRFDPPGGKTIRPRDVVRGVDGMPPVRPLYNLPGIAANDYLVLVEGEKCAQSLMDQGICATTLMGGAKTPVEKTDLSPLRGKHILIWPDHDTPGADYALRVGQAAMDAGAKECAILQPPSTKPDKWDAADAVAEDFDIVEFLRTGDRVALQATQAPAAPVDVDDAETTVRGSEDQLALTFTRCYAADWRYVAQWGQWMVWTGVRWQSEQTLCAQHLIRHVCRDAALQADSARTAAKLSSHNTASGVERMARSDRRHAATSEEWDADIWLLNTPGGVVDLTTGQLRGHDRADRMTRITTATPGGVCPNWHRFLATVTGANVELQAYLARMVGYALTGSTREHALFFLYGTGANGKSVFLNTLAALFGDYATNAPMDTFMDTRSERHPTDLAGLRGARMVSAIETEQGRGWNEAKVKAITGGDKISARFMRQDFFEYLPQFKLVIAGNHKPSIRNVDEAMKRRLHLIPFTVTIPAEQRDGKLTEKLLQERDGILAWAVDGCLRWQSEGLNPPNLVVSATAEYFDEEDAIGDFLEEEIQRHPQARVAVSEIFQRWQEWATKRGEYVGTSRWLAQQLTNRGFERARLHGGVKGLIGLSLKPKEFDNRLAYID